MMTNLVFLRRLEIIIKENFDGDIYDVAEQYEREHPDEPEHKGWWCGVGLMATIRNYIRLRYGYSTDDSTELAEEFLIGHY